LSDNTSNAFGEAYVRYPLFRAGMHLLDFATDIGSNQVSMCFEYA
jgi:hypothetical protein